MQVAWTIARKELRELRRDGRLVAMVAVTSLVAVVAVWSAARQTIEAATERLHAQQAERDRWVEQGDVNPHAAAHYGTFVFAPTTPLALVDPGVTPYVPAAVFLEAHQQQVGRHRPVADALTFRRLADVSVTTMLQVVAPLLAVLLGATSVARERDRGTWRLLLVSGAGGRAVIAGKALALAAGLALGVGPAIVAAVGAAGAFTSGPLDGDEAVRGVLLVVGYGAYLALWIALTLALSMRARTATRALGAGVALWLAVCIVGPPALMTAATFWAPAPTVAEFTAAIDDERATRPSWDDRVAAATERFLNGEELPVASNPEVVALIDTEAADTELFGRHLATLAGRLEQQEQVYRRLAWLSPAAAMQALSMTLAGTDYAHHRAFERAAAAYRVDLLRALNDDLAAFDAWKTFSAAGSREAWARVPEFQFEPPSVSWALGRAAEPASALALWALLAIVVVGRATSRSTTA